MKTKNMKEKEYYKILNMLKGRRVDGTQVKMRERGGCVCLCVGAGVTRK